MGEVDRKPLFDVVRVENEIGTPGFLRVEPGVQLSKGGKRVTIVNPVTKAEPLDIILHDNEVFVRKSSFPFAAPGVSGKDIKLLNGSINHSLALVE